MATLFNTNAVYIDTNLDTHLVVEFSGNDTVSDLKNRFALQHLSCFPEIGHIIIHSIKVKGREPFFLLPDSLFVRTAFNGINKPWYLTVDASPACRGIANGALVVAGDNLQLENKRDESEETDNVSRCVSQQTDGGGVKNLEIGVSVECVVDGSDKGVKDDSVVPEEEGTCETAPATKKRHKNKRKRQDTVQRDNSKDIIAYVDKQVFWETEVLKEHTELNSNNTKNDDIDSVSIKEASEPRPAGKKRPKKRKRSLAPQNDETHVVTSSRNDGEADQSTSEDCLLSKDICMRKTIIDNMGIGADAAKESTQSTVKRTLKPSDVNEPKELTDHDENAVRGQCHKSEAGQTERAEEGRELSTQNDPNLEKCTQQDNTNANIREFIVSSKVMDVNVMNEPVKSEKKRTEQDKSSGLGLAQEEGADGGEDAAKERTQPIVKSTLQPSDVNEPKELTDHDENAVRGQCHKSEAGQTERAEEGRELSTQNDPNLEKCTQQDNTNANIREFIVSSKVMDVNVMNEPVKSEKKRTEQDKSSGLGLAQEEGADGGEDAAKERTQPIVKSTLQPSDVNEPKELTDHDENAVRGQCHKSEAGQTERAEEGRELSTQNDPNLEKCTQQDNTNANIREFIVSSKVMDVNVMNEPVKSEKRTEQDKSSGLGLAQEEGADGGEDAAKERTQPIVKSTLQPSDVNEPKELGEHDESAVHGQCHESEVGQTERAEEGRELSIQNDPNLEKCTLFKQDNTNANIRELNVSSKVMDVNVMNEPAKSEKKKTEQVKSSGHGQAQKEGADGGEDAAKESTQSTVKRTLQPSDVNEPKELGEHDENAVYVQCHKSEAGQSERAEEGRELSIQNDPNLEKCILFKQDNTNANIRELNVSPKVMDVNFVNEPVKSKKKKKRTEQDKSSGLGLAQKEGADGGEKMENVERSSLKTSLSGTKGMRLESLFRRSSIYKKAKIRVSMLDETEGQAELVPDTSSVPTDIKG